MTEQEFFAIYIPAVRKAIITEVAFGVSGPDWFIDDKAVMESVMNFEEKNYDEHAAFFDMVHEFLDAYSHNFPTVGDYPIEKSRRNLEEMLDIYEQRYKSM